MGRPIIQSFPAASTTAIANNVNFYSLGNDSAGRPSNIYDLNIFAHQQLGAQGTASPIGFTTTSNYSSNTISLYGLNFVNSSILNNSNLIITTVTGLNNNTVYTTSIFTCLFGIAANTAGMTVSLVQNANLNSLNVSTIYDFVNMQRNISITSNGNNLSGVIFTVFGTNLNGDLFFESLAGPAANKTVYTANQFSKICNICAYNTSAVNGVSIGTGTLATFSWVKLDILRNMPAHSFGVKISGTVFCKIQTTLDVLETTVSGQGQVLNPNPITIDFATNVSATKMWHNVIN